MAKFRLEIGFPQRVVPENLALVRWKTYFCNFRACLVGPDSLRGYFVVVEIEQILF